MRKILVVLAVVLCCSWANSSFAQDLKLGFVDMKKVLDGYEKVKEGEGQLLKEAEEKNNQREELVKNIKSLREKMELLKDNQKEKKQQELDQKVKQLQDFTYETRTDLRQKRDEKFREIMKEFKNVIEEYGQSRNYDAIIEGELLHYKDKKLDVTNEVIKILNQRYKK